MELVDLLTSENEGGIVVVDDYYSQPELNSVDAEALTNLYRLIDSKITYRKCLCKLLSLPTTANPDEILRHIEPNIEALWQAYETDALARKSLEPLFEDIETQRSGNRPALDAITKFCKDKLKISPSTFGCLDEAADALSNCIVAFVDFRLKKNRSTEDAIADHEKARDSYLTRRNFNGKRPPKLVYLISSSLPSSDNLQAFRTATGIRTAFFHPIRKSDLSVSMLEEQLERWKKRYSAATNLDEYLTTMTTAVKESSDKLLEQLDQVELHDLAILNIFKLAAERESLQSYLTWLLSEALASKLRTSPALQKELLPVNTHLPPLDGKLKLGSLLFEIFSQIAISPASLNTSIPSFGDIYVSKKAPKQTQTNNETTTNSRDIHLVITPACDLLRCDDSFNALCVEGIETVAKPNMEELLKEGILFGNGSHVIQYGEGAKKTYAYIRWNKKGLRTISVKDLSSTRKYSKIARLSELFAQEIKEQVLSDVSRIGLPIYPTFSVSARILVRCKFGNMSHECDLSAEDFEGAMVTKGKVESTSQEIYVIGFAEQFATWMRTEFIPQAKGKFNGGKIPNEFLNIEEFFNDWSNYNVELAKNKQKSECGGPLVFKFVEQINDGEAPNNKVEIIVAAAEVASDSQDFIAPK